MLSVSSIIVITVDKDSFKTLKRLFYCVEILAQLKVNFSIIKIREEKPRPTQRIRSAENKIDINAINKTGKENEFNQSTKTIR